MNSLLLFAALCGVPCSPSSGTQLPVLVEAESFANLGGWVVDPQFMDIMGSPYLLAHGLGTPVTDAETTATVPAAGTYRVWIR
ncbi:MAG: pyridine nucleotide-disulfide oxidoreductase, partial [Pirellulaceae bacterium]|nr:pyridine nucleotide-disulfide oxidoreductase [Pirellulaceae bacterium]